jgi:hypothetical protein
MSVSIAGGIACRRPTLTAQRSRQDWSAAELAEHGSSRAQGLDGENGVICWELQQARPSSLSDLLYTSLVLWLSLCRRRVAGRGLGRGDELSRVATCVELLTERRSRTYARSGARARWRCLRFTSRQIATTERSKTRQVVAGTRIQSVAQAAAGVHRHQRGSRAYTPDSIAVPLVQGAIEFLTSCAIDVLSARASYAALVSQVRTPRLGKKAHYHQAAKWLRARPINTPLGVYRFRTPSEFYELVDMLYAACFVVIAYLVGPR